MYDEDFDPDYDPGAEERNFRASADGGETDPAQQGRCVHVQIVDGWGTPVHGWGADPVAVITTDNPEYGRWLADLINGQPVTPAAATASARETKTWADARALAADIADLLARGGYPIDATTDQVEAALPMILAALAKHGGSDTALQIARFNLQHRS